MKSEIVERNGAGTRVRLEGGIELAIRTAGLRPDATRALLSVRPEKIYITRGRPAKENAFRGVIEEEVFRGAMDELSIRVSGGPEFMAVVANESAHERAWHKGDAVFCAIHADDIVVVEQE